MLSVSLAAMFTAVVGFRILRGDISTQGLLLDKKISGQLSAARVQGLVVVLSVALYILVEIASDPTVLPEVPAEMLLLLFGSQAGYLGVKGRRALLSLIGRS